MLFLLDKDVKTVKWNGQPLHEASKAIVSEEINGDYILNVTYPITDTRIYKLLKEDMLIIAPTPTTGRQLFRIKEVKEDDDFINLTCPHITEDVFKRSIRPLRVSNATAQTALNTMITQSKTSLGIFTFSSNIFEKRTFTTTEVETLYNILLDGKHSIVGTWEGEIIRNNFLIDIQKNRGTDRGVVITTHQSLNKYDRERNSSSVITRIHLKSTFKPEGSEQERTINITIDSPLINDYPYINEAEYENNNLKTEAELRKWDEAKFKNGNIDKPSDKIEIEAYELDGQNVNLGDTARIMSLKHDVMAKKKAVGYKFDALSEEYLTITFDDKAGIGGSRSISSSISDVASEIIDTFNQKNNGDFEKNLQALIENANREFDLKSEALKQEITDGLEQAKSRSEELKKEVTDSVNSKFADFDRSFNTQLDSQKERIQAINELANDANRVATEALRDGNNAIKYALSVKSLADHNFTTVRNLNDKIDLLATKQELDPITERLRLTESQIELQADQITEKLSRTEVDRLIDGKGFQNAVQVQNIVKKSVDGFQQTISRVENKLRDVIRNDNLLQNSSTIPTGNGLEGTWRPNISGGNGRTEVVSLTDAPHTAIKKGIRIVGNTNGGNKDFGQFVNLEIGQKYTISCWARVHSNSSQNNVNFLMRSYTSNDRNRILVKNISNRDWVRYQFTFTADAVNNSIQFGQNGNGSLEICGMKLEHSDRMTDYDVNTSEIVSVVEFNDVVDTVKSHTQTIQRQNESISQVIQTADGLVTRVSNFLDDFNLVYDPTNVSKWNKKQPEANIIEVQASTKLLRITNSGNTNNVYRGFALPIMTSSFTKDEKLSYRIEAWVDVLPDAPLGIELWNDNSVIASDRVSFTQTGRQIITGTMTVNKTTNNSRDYPLEFWLLKNGTVAIGKVSLIRGDRPPKKFADNTSTQDVATQTQVSKLAGSYAIKNLNSAGDLINGINVAADGNNRIDGRLTHITGQTLIDNAVIKSAMVDKLKTGNFESGSVTTQILASNAVTADKLLVDSAMINKLVTNQAFIKELFSQRATITQIQSVDITGEHVRGGRITSLNGNTVIDLQTGWIETNGQGVGIKNKFPGRPLQYLVFGAGRIGDVDGSYTALLSNRNGVQAMDHTSAGIQIWNGRSNGKIASAITFYGQTMDFLLSGQENLKGVSIDIRTRNISGLLDVYIRDRSLVNLFNNIDYNFQQIINHFKQNDLGWPSQYRTNI
nr:MAG TPA: tail protein [Caudoviricetes sp.]